MLEGADHARRYRRLSRAQQLERLEVLRRAEIRLQALQTELLALLDDDPDPLGKDFGDEEVACVLRVSSHQAGGLLEASARLVETFPAALVAMHAGEVPAHYGRRLAERTIELSDAACAAVEKTVLVKAARQTFGQFRNSLDRAVAEHDTLRITERHELARATRGIWWGPPDRNGMASPPPRHSLMSSPAAFPLAHAVAITYQRSSPVLTNGRRTRCARWLRERPARSAPRSAS